MDLCHGLPAYIGSYGSALVFLVLRKLHGIDDIDHIESRLIRKL